MDRIFQLMDKFSEKNADHMPKPADYTKVDEALARVPEDLSLYTDETVKAVEDAVAAVKRDLTVTQQEQVDKMAADVNAAVDALTMRDADYTKVDAALKTVPKDLSLYTDESAKAVEDAVAAVKRGYKVDKQDDVDKMAADIEAAVKALVKKPATSPDTKPEQKPAGKPSAGLPATGDPAMLMAATSAFAGMGALVLARKKR